MKSWNRFRSFCGIALTLFVPIALYFSWQLTSGSSPSLSAATEGSCQCPSPVTKPVSASQPAPAAFLSSLQWDSFSDEALRKRYPLMATSSQLRAANKSRLVELVSRLRDASGMEYVLGHGPKESYHDLERKVFEAYTSPIKANEYHARHLLKTQSDLQPTLAQCWYMPSVHIEREPVLFYASKARHHQFSSRLHANVLLNSRCQLLLHLGNMLQHRVTNRRSVEHWQPHLPYFRQQCERRNVSSATIPMLSAGRYNFICATDWVNVPHDGLRSTLACVARVFAVFGHRPSELARTTVVFVRPELRTAADSFLQLYQRYLTELHFSLVPINTLLIFPNAVVPCLIPSVPFVKRVLLRDILWPRINRTLSRSLLRPASDRVAIINLMQSASGRNFVLTTAFAKALAANGFELIDVGSMGMDERIYRTTVATYIMDSTGSNAEINKLLDQAVFDTTVTKRKLTLMHTAYSKEGNIGGGRCADQGAARYCCVGARHLFLMPLPNDSLDYFDAAMQRDYIEWRTGADGFPLLCTTTNFSRAG